MSTCPRWIGQIIEQWRANKVFERSLDATAGGEAWTFYEGPPTANGMPGTHHVEARVFKDVFPGSRPCRATTSPAWPAGTATACRSSSRWRRSSASPASPTSRRTASPSFNERCRASVQRHVDAFAAMSERMGYWADYDNAYWTMNPDYIQSVWWALKTIFDKGLLVEDYRVTPYCPRCGTGLSDHELGQRRRLHRGRRPGGLRPVPGRSPARRPGVADLVVWTTTPWTLVSNTAVAVHPTVDYVVARTAAGTFVVAEPLLSAVLGDNAQVLRRYSGATSRGWHYRPPFDYVSIAGAHVVVLADYVTTEDGSGLVHQAPAFGADDMEIARTYGLPVVNPIGAMADSAVISRTSAGCSSRMPTGPRGQDFPKAAGCCGMHRMPTPTRTAGAATPR